MSMNEERVIFDVWKMLNEIGYELIETEDNNVKDSTSLRIIENDKDKSSLDCEISHYLIFKKKFNTLSRGE
jgi:hypothetical protein